MLPIRQPSVFPLENGIRQIAIRPGVRELALCRRNHRRLLQPIGNIPPAEAEDRYYAILERPAMAA